MAQYRGVIAIEWPRGDLGSGPVRLDGGLHARHDRRFRHRPADPTTSTYAVRHGPPSTWIALVTADLDLVRRRGRRTDPRRRCSRSIAERGEFRTGGAPTSSARCGSRSPGYQLGAIVGLRPGARCRQGRRDAPPARHGAAGRSKILVPGSSFAVNRPLLLPVFTKRASVINYRPHIDIRAEDGSCSPQVARHEDAPAAV